MALTPAERERLEDYRQVMGPGAGGLAPALGCLPHAVAHLGQHKGYCPVGRGPPPRKPPLDLAELLAGLENAKSLVQEALLRLRDDRPPPAPARGPGR